MPRLFDPVVSTTLCSVRFHNHANRPQRGLCFLCMPLIRESKQRSILALGHRKIHFRDYLILHWYPLVIHRTQLFMLSMRRVIRLQL